MKPIATLGLLFLMLLLTVPADAQIVCGSMGAFTSCDGPRGSYTIQTDMGHGTGTVMDHKGNLEPYTIMPYQSQPKPPSDLSRRPSLPSYETPQTLPSPYQGFETPASPLFLPGFGGDAGQ